MNIETMASVLSSCVSLILIWWVVSWLVRDYFVDRFRESMFALRAELYDVARSGLISFDHPAYGTLRTTMNGFIRFGHQISFSRVLVILSFVDLKSVPSFTEKWGEATKDLEPEVNERLTNFTEKMNAIVGKHLVVTSPTLLLLLVVTIVFILCFKLSDRIVEFFRPSFNKVDSVAMMEGRTA